VSGSAGSQGKLNLGAATLFAALTAAVANGCGPGRTMNAGRSPRLIGLAPSITESLFALGVGSEVVGVSQYCDYPPEVQHLPKIGSFIAPNLEAILALQPTLVIGLPTTANLPEIRALQSVGIRTLMVDDGSVAAIVTGIQKIGEAVGRRNAAQKLVAQMFAQMNHIEERLAGVPPRSVLMVVGHDPLVAVGAGTYLDELIRLAHGRNIAEASGQAWPRLSIEYIVAIRPEVILDGQMGTDTPASSRFWSRFPSIPAVGQANPS
jgi:iron complex transport system substrate-binding protein